MGRVFEEFVESTRVFRCAKCNAHLARNEDIISKVASSCLPSLLSVSLAA